MNIFFNPRTAPGWTLMVALSLLSFGTFFSWARLKTVAAEHQTNDIAQYRADICRILPPSDRVELGAYYFQGTGKDAQGNIIGSLLSEGTYVCDIYGNSGRIERGGYAQFVVTATDISSINKTLKKRLEDPSNPDSSELSKVRRATNLGVHRTEASSPENQFFNLK